MARATAQDPHSGLPAAEALAREIPELDLLDADARSISVEEKNPNGAGGGKTALEYDPRITNCEGGEFSNQFGRVIYVSSHGFSGEYEGSTFGHSVAPVAAQNGSMQRDYWYSSNRKFSRLESPKSRRESGAAGVEAARAKKVKPAKFPLSLIRRSRPRCYGIYHPLFPAIRCTRVPRF